MHLHGLTVLLQSIVQLVNKQLADMADEDRQRFLKAHQELATLARACGLDLPSFTEVYCSIWFISALH